MNKGFEINRYALYGENHHAIAPEFLHIETIAARSRQHGWTISPHAHPDIFQLLLLEKGSGALMSGQGQVPLAPFSLVTAPKGAVHGFFFNEDAQGWVLSIAGALLHDTRLSHFTDTAPLTGSRACHRNISSDEHNARRLGWLMADLARTADQASLLPPPLVAELAMTLALVAQIMKPEDHAPANPGGIDALAARFGRLVETWFRTGWNIERYARELATSTPTLTRACRMALGRAPGEVVHERLLLEAMRLLTYTASDIGQIGLELGFADPAYFARFFKTRTGMTASAFRQTGAWVSTRLTKNAGE